MPPWLSGAEVSELRVLRAPCLRVKAFHSTLCLPWVSCWMTLQQPALRGFDIERTAPEPRSGSEPSPGVDSHHPEHHRRRGSRPKPSLGGRSGAKAANTAFPPLSAMERRSHDTACYRFSRPRPALISKMVLGSSVAAVARPWRIGRICMSTPTEPCSTRHFLLQARGRWP